MNRRRSRRKPRRRSGRAKSKNHRPPLRSSRKRRQGNLCAQLREPRRNWAQRTALVQRRSSWAQRRSCLCRSSCPPAPRGSLSPRSGGRQLRRASHQSCLRCSRPKAVKRTERAADAALAMRELDGTRGGGSMEFLGPHATAGAGGGAAGWAQWRSAELARSNERSRNPRGAREIRPGLRRAGHGATPTRDTDAMLSFFTSPAKNSANVELTCKHMRRIGGTWDRSHCWSGPQPRSGAKLATRTEDEVEPSEPDAARSHSARHHGITVTVLMGGVGRVARMRPPVPIHPHDASCSSAPPTAARHATCAGGTHT